MKYTLKKIALIFLSTGFIINFRIKKISKKNYLTILNLHRVCMDDGSAYKPLNPTIFDQLLKFLVKNYHIITFSEVENFSGEVISSKPLLIISFDDGYKDFINVTVPILFKYKIKVNQNIIPECVESGMPPLNVLIQDFIGKADKSDIIKLKISGFEVSDNIDDRLQMGLKVSKFIKNKPMHEQKIINDEIMKNFDFDLTSYRTPMLDMEDIKELKDEHELGVHSYSHSNMGLETDDYVKEDLMKCKNWFTKNLNTNVEIYAFPNGSYKENHIKLCKDYGYKHILLVNDNFSNLNSGIYNRFGFHADSFREVKFKTLGGFCKI